MRFDGGRNHEHFNLDGAGPRGPTSMVFAAKDPVMVPTEPAIVDGATKALCTIKVGTNEYVVTNVYGVQATVPFGAPVAQWQTVFDALLEQAMTANDS